MVPSGRNILTVPLPLHLYIRCRYNGVPLSWFSFLFSLSWYSFLAILSTKRYQKKIVITMSLSIGKVCVGYRAVDRILGPLNSQGFRAPLRETVNHPEPLKPPTQCLFGAP